MTKFQILKQDNKTGKIEVVVKIMFNNREAAEKYMMKRLIPEGKPFYLYPYYVAEVAA